MTKSRKGTLTKKVTVHTNDAGNRKVMLTCTVRLLEPFRTEPQIVDFQLVDRTAGPLTQTVTITRGDGGPLAPELLPSRSPQLAARLREVEPGEKYEIEVTLSPPWPARAFRGTVPVQTGLPNEPEGRITVRASFVPRLRAVPRQIRIPANLTTETELKAKLIWAGEKPGKITRVMVNEPSLRVRIEEENGESFVVLTVPADYQRRTVAFATLHTDDLTMRILRLPIMPRMAGRTPNRPSTGPPDGETGEIPPPPGERARIPLP